MLFLTETPEIENMINFIFDPEDTQTFYSDQEIIDYENKFIPSVYKILKSYCEDHYEDPEDSMEFIIMGYNPNNLVTYFKCIESEN